MLSQDRSKRKPTGGRLRDYRKKKLHMKARGPILTKIDQVDKVRKARVRSGQVKLRVLTTTKANIYDPKTKKFKNVKVKTELENSADANYVRRNIINKGSIIDTEAGKAKITSRPGQDGVVNAVLIE